MVSWAQFAAEAADLATRVHAAFGVRKHCTLATLRRDGSPRISGTEVEFSEGDVFLGSMPGAVKARDLQRDGRFALHSATIDPPEEAPSDWPGEAKLAGVAVDVTPPGEAGQPHRFGLDLAEVVHTRVDGDELVVTSWHRGRGVTVTRRR